MRRGMQQSWVLNEEETPWSYYYPDHSNESCDENGEDHVSAGERGQKLLDPRSRPP